MKTFEEILFDSFNYLDYNEVIEDFENHFNEEYSFFDVGGPFTHMEPTEVLMVMDNYRYEHIQNDYIKENFTEVEKDKYFRTDEYEQALEMFEEEKIEYS